MKKILCGMLLFVLMFTCVIDAMALPSSGSLRYRVSRRDSAGRTPAVRHVATIELNEVLGIGEQCEVTLSACMSRFVSSGNANNPDNRKCEGIDVGTVNLSPGDQSLRVRSQSRSGRKRRGIDRQMSLQYEADCTGDTDVEFNSQPRARNVTIDSARGATDKRFLNQVRNNFSG